MGVSKKQCHKLSDLEIVRKSLLEVDHFSCLYERYENRLLVYIKHLGNITNEEAEDILQEAFVKVWKHLNDFDQRLKFSSWLYRIVHNQAISALRKKASFGKSNKQPFRDKYLMDAVSQFSEDSDLVEEQSQCVHKIINQLPLPFKEVMVLKYFENMSYEEISDVLQIPEGTVATRINRAKKTFRKFSTCCSSLRALVT